MFTKGPRPLIHESCSLWNVPSNVPSSNVSSSNVQRFGARFLPPMFWSNDAVYAEARAVLQTALDKCSETDRTEYQVHLAEEALRDAAQGSAAAAAAAAVVEDRQVAYATAQHEEARAVLDLGEEIARLDSGESGHVDLLLDLRSMFHLGWLSGPSKAKNLKKTLMRLAKHGVKGPAGGPCFILTPAEDREICGLLKRAYGVLREWPVGSLAQWLIDGARRGIKFLICLVVGVAVNIIGNPMFE